MLRVDWSFCSAQSVSCVLQFQASVDEGSKGIVVNLTVDDRDDPATGAWRAIYSIINGDPNHNFAIHTNPDNNEGMLSVVKVQALCCYLAVVVIQNYSNVILYVGSCQILVLINFDQFVF